MWEKMANEDYIQAFMRQRNEESGRREETEGESHNSVEKRISILEN